jgi:asparagine synthase (glutamine-hydrolysing)
MCGLIGYSGNFLKDDLTSGLAKIDHRGPDDSGTYFDDVNQIGLGHCRLSILDLSPLGHQPMISEDGLISLVFNGEIYNFKDLREELIQKGYEFKGNSDTEVLLKLYLEMGKKMLVKLNGIFAFAIYDSRSNITFIAKDRFGIKPLYFSQTSDGFAYASEIKGLVDLVPSEKEIDFESLNRYLSFLWCPGEGTPLKNIKKLLPGEALFVKNGKILKRWIWFELPIFKNIKANLSQNEAIKGTKKFLKQAVQRQLVSDVPVGAFLSGGLDSSSIVAMAKLDKPDIQCFTIETSGGVEDGMADDLPYAKKAAKFLDVDLNVISIDSRKMCDDIVDMVQQLDEPLSDPAALNLRYISQLAREQGIKVLLSGAGGDDLFTGYRRHQAIALDKYWNWAPQKARQGIEQMTSKLDQRNVNYRRITKFFNGAGLDEHERLANFFIWSKQDDLVKLFNNDLKNEFIKLEPIHPMLDFLSPLSEKSIKPLDKMLALEQRFFLTDHNLNYTDKMSMSSSIEVRVPFLDNDLVDFSQKIPLNLKQKNGQGKYILKKSMEDYLPKEIIYRPKTGFGAPLRHWMRNDLKDLVGDILSYESINKRGFFNAEEVQKMVALNYQGKIDASYTIFSILCIEIWCRSFID